MFHFRFSGRRFWRENVLTFMTRKHVAWKDQNNDHFALPSAYVNIHLKTMGLCFTQESCPPGFSKNLQRTLREFIVRDTNSLATHAHTLAHFRFCSVLSPGPSGRYLARGSKTSVTPTWSPRCLCFCFAAFLSISSFTSSEFSLSIP